ncbi:MAG: tetratricopeptide repeat protein [Geobacteraceae bacterium]|nr:tetratricopeptide repeat protein [Geobacteraceae bacterium]
MKKKDSSSWSEIKSLDERLSREPDSFCFARLSEIYLKVGLVADALHTARQGVARHPGYLSGQRALAMACNANGLHDESRTILEKFTAAMPEDTAAQKLLASLYVEAGDTAAAIMTYRTVLDFRPDDAQTKSRLEDIQRGDSGETLQSTQTSGTAAYEEKVVVQVEDAEDDVYELTEEDIVHDEDDFFEKEQGAVAAVHHDPLSTLTLAELYEQQGFIAKALDIYRTLLADNPGNLQLKDKVSRLELQASAPEALSEQAEAPEIEDEFEMLHPVAPEEAAADEDVPFIVSPVPEEDTVAVPEQPVSAAFEDMAAPVETQDFSPLVHNQADNVVEALDSLLENIRRIKACR